MTTLSFDGCGINGPDEYRSRIATFDLKRLSKEELNHYGNLFASAPEVFEALEALIDAVKSHNSRQSNLGDCIVADLYPAMDAIAKAKGVKP